MMFTQSELHKVLYYNPNTGIFTRQKSGKSACRSDLTKGYKRVFVFRKYYKAHRLAWFYMTGAWPKYQIDHIDGNKCNNVFSNLRDVEQSVNKHNRFQPYNNSELGVLGIYKYGNKYLAAIRHNNVLTKLGVFDDITIAKQAYDVVKQSIVWQTSPL